MAVFSSRMLCEEPHPQQRGNVVLSQTPKLRELFQLLLDISTSGWEDGNCSGKLKAEGGSSSSTLELVTPLYPSFARNPLLQHTQTHTHRA